MTALVDAPRWPHPPREPLETPAPSLALGRYPTPVERLDPAQLPPMGGAAIWVKRDDKTHDVVGGNKVRKLELLLADARARGATHVWTVGAAGSHHVLATTYFGRREGFSVGAILVPQPRTEHVVLVLRASLALGLEAKAVGSWGSAMATILWRLGPGRASDHAGRRSHFITVGGSNTLGAMAYVRAARELAGQVRAGEMPEPDLCVVALGSGGTAAGLAAGFALEGLKTEVVGIAVSPPVWMLEAITANLIGACLSRAHRERGETPRTMRTPKWSVDPRMLGRGYGCATAEGERASAVGARVGLELDATYTAKAFAGALTHAKEAASKKVVLYWHTLSSAPLAPLGHGDAEGARDTADSSARARVDAHMARLAPLLLSAVLPGAPPDEAP
jgi:1-aminocyclopropane-1-carboxylate deaminase/D-cysteine desulfhydrase-like pyridoxal-dependent ACC family enzyme